MRLFTIAEANEILPVVRPKLEQLSKYYERTSILRQDAKAAAAASGAGGGMKGGSLYVQALHEIGRTYR